MNINVRRHVRSRETSMVETPKFDRGKVRRTVDMLAPSERNWAASERSRPETPIEMFSCVYIYINI